MCLAHVCCWWKKRLQPRVEAGRGGRLRVRHLDARASHICARARVLGPSLAGQAGRSACRARNPQDLCTPTVGVGRAVWSYKAN